MSATTSRHKPKLAAALRYVRLGWAVLTLHYPAGSGCSCGNSKCRSEGKHPFAPHVPHGYKNASTDEAEVRRWLSDEPLVNIAVATGAVSGLIGLDVDERHGGLPSLKALEKKFPELRATQRFRTGGGGGIRILLSYPAGANVKSRSDLRGYPGVEVLSDGKQTVMPPSVHKSGRRYRWQDGHRPGEVELLEPSDALLMLITEKRRAPKKDSASTTTGIQIADGHRNDELVVWAGKLLQKGLTAPEIGATLSAINATRCTPPLDADEVQQIAEGVAERYATNGPACVGDVLPDAPAGAKHLHIPEPYALDASATTYVKIVRGKPVFERVANVPIVIIGRLRDVTTGQIALRIVWRRPKGQWHEMVVDRRVALDTRSLVPLAGDDFPVGSDNARAVVRYLRCFDDLNHSSLPCAKVSSSLGWQGVGGVDGFLIGDTLLHEEGSETDADGSTGDLTFRALDIGEKQLAAGYTTQGMMEGWLDAVQILQRFPKALFGLYAGLAAPLVEILDAPNFIIDWSANTSTGKSTVLRVAASLWGQPDEQKRNSVLFGWDATKVWVERTGARLLGLPLILDDTSLATDGRSIADLLYRFAFGKGRGRGSLKGTASVDVSKTILLSSGEAPVTSFSEHGGTRGRVLVIHGPPFGGESEKHGRRVMTLNQDLRENFGFAGPQFVKYLLQRRRDWPKLVALYSKWVRRLASSASSSAGGRLAQYAAVVHVAGWLAHKALPLPWDWRSPVTHLWPAITAEASDPVGALRALRDVMSWVRANRARFDDDENPRDDEDRPLVPCYGRWAGRGGRKAPPFVAVYPDELKGKLRQLKFNPDVIIAEWKKLGWLVLSEGKGACKNVRVSGHTAAPLVAINLSAVAKAGA